MKLDMVHRRPRSLSTIEVRLSRRNLRALLAKLDGKPPVSACTILRYFPQGELVVIAEEDAVHYAGRQPGEMHPSTEEEIK